jgi:outer membrane protein TolC
VKSFLILLSLVSCIFADMSIKDAWLMVEQSSNGLKAAKDDESIASLKKESVKSMYLPEISISGSYTHLSEPIGTDTHTIANSLASTLPITSTVMSALPNQQMDFSKQDVFLANLHMLWPLYTGGKIDAAQDIYAAASDEAKAVMQMKKDKEFLKLIKYYYGVVVTLSLYETRKEAQKALKLHYENAKKLKEHGQIANIELLDAKVKLDGAKIETTKAKHKYEIAISALSSLLKQKIQPSSNLVVNELMEDEEYYTTQTQQNYAGLNILDAKKKQSEAFVKIKESNYHPTVVGYANYNLYKDDSPIMNTLPQWFGGVMVRISLLKRKDRAQEVQAAKLLNSKIKHLKDEALENLAILVEKTYKEMNLYKEEYNSLSSSIELAKENYKLRAIAFKEGLSTSVEVVDAQMFLLGAKTKRLNAAYNYEKKLSQLCVLSGDREMFFKMVGR